MPTKGAKSDELVFVVDVSSFTKKGFLGATSYEGTEIILEFDEDEEGVFLSREMALRLGIRRDSPLSVVVEDNATTVVESKVAGISKSFRVSSAKVYYAIGKEGGAVVRIRKR